MCAMSQCKKFAPNIFHKTKCSNCFRQKEEHSAEALECNRASRSIARSGYLFVAPDWDFSVPLNRTKRWQRRWFVLYDDGELNYSVDEHPDTVPQGSVDMSKVLEVTGAEQVTGHPHSLALTSPDRVTFVKAASREDARWWAELLAVFPRRHKRNATFPGGRASPSLPQLGRSASPQPPRPRHLSVTGASPRANFTTPPLKEERESPPKDEKDDGGGNGSLDCTTWTIPEPTGNAAIEAVNARKDYVLSSGSPPTRDKLRCDDKAKARQDWRNERLRDIATALTDRSPESSLALPAEGLLHLKKGWLWLQDDHGDWSRKWVVLCGPSLNIYRDQDEQFTPEITIEMSNVIFYNEIPTESKYGFQIQCNGSSVTLSAVTAGIRNNWLLALKKAAPHTPESPPAPATPRSILLSSDEEYRTASEGGRRGSEDWGDLPPSPPLTRTPLTRVKERARARPRLPRSNSRHSTLDSVSTDELDSSFKESETDLRNTINKQRAEIDDLQKQLSKAASEVHKLEEEVNRLKKVQSECISQEKKTKEMLVLLKQTERELNQKNSQLESKYSREQKMLQRRLSEAEELARNRENKCSILAEELKSKQFAFRSLQEDLECAKERLLKYQQENERLYNRLQELDNSRSSLKSYLSVDSLTDLTNVDLDVELETLNEHELVEHCLDLRSRFEKAVVEIRTIKRQLRESHGKCDSLEIEKLALEKNLEDLKKESQAEKTTMVARIDHLTNKLLSAEKQLRNRTKEGRDKRRSLSLKGRESFSINKEVEDKVTELEMKLLSLDKHKRRIKRDRSSERNSPIDDRSLRRLRRKSLDGATTSEPMKLLMRLSTLDSKIQNVMASNESINTVSNNDLTLDPNATTEDILIAAKEKLNECIIQVGYLKSGKSKRSPSPNSERLNNLEQSLIALGDILRCGEGEMEVAISSANSVVKQLQMVLLEKLASMAEKKRALRDSGKFDKRAAIEILAEKVAFENVVIGRIQEAIYSPGSSEPVCERLLQKEATETRYLLTNLQRKLSGMASMEPPICHTSADYLSRVLSKCLLTSCQDIGEKKALRRFSPGLKSLQEDQRKVDCMFESYKAKKLPQIADALAVESLSLSSDKSCRVHGLNAENFNEFGKVVQDTVKSELIQLEINHILLRAAQIYEINVNADNENFFSFFASERAALELWSDNVESRLYGEIENVIQEVLDHYHSSLNKFQRQNWRRRIETKNSQCLLSEFADVVAHKVLIDARISVLSEDENRPLIGDGNTTTCLERLLQADACKDFLEDQSSIQTNQSLEAEFKCMVDRYSSECRSTLERSERESLSECVNRVCVKLCELKKVIGVSDDECVNERDDTCLKCNWIYEQLDNLQKVFEEDVEITRKKINTSEEHRPVYLGTEYLSQVENLRSAYRRALASCEDRHARADLEQLQVLCERVLVAMEHWHRRALHDLREAHGRELKLLRQDKEQALAEETQATLAALDAMRKAHEAEVQREVARFKQEFARQQRDELVDLSERLSVKCLEAAALEEQLSSTSRQLAHAQEHILQLERNPQLSNMQN